MKTTKFSFYFDIIFDFILFFIIAFVWLRFYFHNGITVILLSVLISLIINIIIVNLKIRKNNKIKISLQDKINAQNFTTEMLYLTEKEQCKKICELLNIPIKNIKKNSVIYNKVAIKPLYLKSKVSKFDIIKTISQLKHENINKILICSHSFEEDCKNFLNQFNDIEITLVNETEFYFKVLKNINYTSNLKPLPKPKRQEYFKNLLSVAFNKKRFKGYLLTGFLLFLCSLIYRYNIYYIVFSSLMFIFAFISKYNNKYNKKNNINLFELNK